MLDLRLLGQKGLPFKPLCALGEESGLPSCIRLSHPKVQILAAASTCPVLATMVATSPVELFEFKFKPTAIK